MSPGREELLDIEMNPLKREGREGGRVLSHKQKQTGLPSGLALLALEVGAVVLARLAVLAAGAVQAGELPDRARVAPALPRRGLVLSGRAEGALLGPRRQLLLLEERQVVRTEPACGPATADSRQQ